MFSPCFYQEITNSVRVEVSPSFLPEDSRPLQQQYLFRYDVAIENNGELSIELLRRKWLIRDGQRSDKIVEGEGVVGKRPKLAPQSTFRYSSYCALPTPTGNMRGHYLFKNEQGRTFTVDIPLFFLRSSDQWPH